LTLLKHTVGISVNISFKYAVLRLFIIFGHAFPPYPRCDRFGGCCR